MNDTKLYNLFKEFVFEIHPLIDPAIEKKWIKPKYDKYPNLTYNDNGMPRLSNHSYPLPYKISELFRSWGGNADIELKNYESYKKLSEYLVNHKEYLDCVLPDNFNHKENKDNFHFMLVGIIEDILERYFLLNKNKTENEKLLEQIYLEFEKFVFAKDLDFDISIPLLFLNFAIEEESISETIVIRKIKDEYHKARFSIRSYSPPISDSIISCATHELVFKNYFIQKGKRYFDDNLSNENAYPIDKFELFFNAIKIVTNHNSGFAQLLVYPKGWSDFFNTDLPTLKGTSVKRYPNYFDNYYWNNTSFPMINIDQIKKIAKIYDQLLICENNKIKIANRRLRSSYLRDNEEDSILDIIIALETLLSDNDKGELTHKLSLRIAKLISVFNENYSALEVFDRVKKIYDFRSAVIHGSSKIDTKREIKINKESEPIKIISLANDYLREVIGILIERPEFLNPKEIDKLLLQ